VGERVGLFGAHLNLYRLLKTFNMITIYLPMEAIQNSPNNTHIPLKALLNIVPSLLLNELFLELKIKLNCLNFNL
jgi:hypothetical protein